MSGAEEKAIREARGWTQLQMAEAIGVSETAVWMWEDGRRNISRRSARAIELAAGKPRRKSE